MRYREKEEGRCGRKLIVNLETRKKYETYKSNVYSEAGNGCDYCHSGNAWRASYGVINRARGEGIRKDILLFL
jgi:hypothetical protein